MHENEPSLGEVYRLLQAVNRDVQALGSTLDGVRIQAATTVASLGDHERRIGSLETKVDNTTIRAVGTAGIVSGVMAGLEWFASWKR